MVENKKINNFYTMLKRFVYEYILKLIGEGSIDEDDIIIIEKPIPIANFKYVYFDDLTKKTCNRHK